jgi:hypothetical protein
MLYGLCTIHDLTLCLSGLRPFFFFFLFFPLPISFTDLPLGLGTTPFSFICLSRNHRCWTVTFHSTEMNLQPLFISSTFFPSALDTTAHILAYTVITYILFLNMDNGLGTILHFCV